MPSESTLVQALIALITVAVAWATVRGQITDLVRRSGDWDSDIKSLEHKVTTLEAKHSSLVDQMVEALRKLEDVTKTLQQIAVEIARGSK